MGWGRVSPGGEGRGRGEAVWGSKVCHGSPGRTDELGVSHVEPRQLSLAVEDPVVLHV